MSKEIPGVADSCHDDEKGKSSRDGHKPSISDEIYNRIPDKFKKPSSDSDDSDDSKRRDGGSRPPQKPDSNGNGSENGRRAPVAMIVFILALAATLFLGYRSFFGPKSTEITWTAFNRLLDSNEVKSATLKGGELSGTLNNMPELVEWVDLIPDGPKLFATAIAQYDRAHPNVAKTLNSELNALCDATELQIVRPRVPSPETPLFVSIVRKKTSDLSDATSSGDEKPKVDDDVVDPRTALSETILTGSLPSTASESEVEALKRELAEKFRFRTQIDQRWTLEPINNRRLASSENAMQMVDRKTNKPFGRSFFKKYTCQAPAFAYADGTLDARLRDKLETYSSVPQTDSSWVLTAISIAVTVLFFVFLFRMIRGARDMMGGGGAFSATRSLAKKYDPESGKRATFEDVAGMDQVKAELVEVVDYLKNPAKYERMGARVPRGTLLFGPPGTGKTLLARAVAGEAGVPFYSINGSEFIQMFVGVGASRVRDLFATARENAPAILFIDEIDAVGRQRGAGIGGGQDEREQTLNQILSEMDGFTQTDAVMVMASTNRPDVLDPALMRPGRFDRHITVGRPSMKGRVDIFNVYLKKIPYGSDVDVKKLASQTAGFTGADIRNFVNEATLWATRNDKTQVDACDFDFAFEKIALGLKRDEIITPENKRKTAVHEAGHAIVGWFLPNGTKVHKVTVIPRGRALGVTWSLPEEDKLCYDSSEAKSSLAHLLAGRVAEKTVYGETTSGVENDLQRATELARDMVARWGMSEKLGPVSFPNSENHPFLGREMTSDVRAYSEATAELIDEEIKAIIREADSVAESIIRDKRELFDNLVEALVAEEEVDRERLIEILGPSPADKKSESPIKDEETSSVNLEKSDVASDVVADATPDSSYSLNEPPVWNLPAPPSDEESKDSDDAR